MLLAVVAVCVSDPGGVGACVSEHEPVAATLTLLALEPLTVRPVGTEGAFASRITSVGADTAAADPPAPDAVTAMRSVAPASAPVTV
jgi:hypothetical protein